MLIESILPSASTQIFGVAQPDGETIDIDENNVISVKDSSTNIYGAEQAGASPSLQMRTDDAVGFSDPNPYYSGMTGTPSSPFDDIMPWSGIRRVTDSSAGELVEIPKFWYKQTRTGGTMKLQITADETTATQNSFLVSPAHADRGDGSGERDYVYIGRYHGSINDYKSTSGVTPKVSITRSTARSSIRNLGSKIWQMDYAMWWTVNMLYLVEFADWNSQAKIGYGCGNNSSTEKMGSTDDMTYHTGTNASSRTTYGHTQYRHIEDLWGNVYNWVDGIYFSSADIYCIKNPASFSDSTGGTKVGTRATTGGWTKGWTNPSVAGFEYALYPNSVDSNLDGSTYICDYCSYNASGVVLSAGGYYGQYQDLGAFFLGGGNAASGKNASIGSRLMVLPSARIN